MVKIKNFGPIDSIYFAYSSDEKIRFLASSGGFVKSFLVYLLESRTVDSVIITRSGPPENPLAPETIITDSKADIVSSRTNSVYMVNNPFQAFHSIDPDKKYAFVGLPCHIRNLKAMQKNGKYENVTFMISLFCNHTPNIEFTEGILQKLNVKKQELFQIEYRGNGWPGGFSAYLKNGQKKYIPLMYYWSNDLDNGPQMCKSCSEIGIQADIYVGDPWNLDFDRIDDKGKSLVICRNSDASALVNRSAELNYIKINKCSPKTLLKSQGLHIEQKLNRGKGKFTVIKSRKSPVLVRRILNLIAHPVQGYKVAINLLSVCVNYFRVKISGVRKKSGQ